MTLNVSFFKKSAITGAGLAIAAGVVMAFFAHASAVHNNQTTTQGTGYVLGLSANQGKLTNVSAIQPNQCAGNAASSILCRCPQLGTLCTNCKTATETNQASICRCDGDNDNDDVFCKCVNTGNQNCTSCFPVNGQDVCAWCPPFGEGACRIMGGNSQGNPAIVTPQGTSSSGTGAGSSSGTVYPSIDANPQTQPSGGNTTGNDPSNPPSSTGCNGNPDLMIACRAPGDNPSDPQPCGYREVCTVQ